MRDFKTWIKGILLKDNNNGPNPVGDLSGSLTANDNGAIYVYQNIIRTWLSNSEHQVLTNDQTQTITNKTINVDNNTVSNIEVDNLKAGVLNTSITLAGAADTQVPSALAVKTYVDDEIAALTAADVAYDNVASGLTATDVQAAIDEVDGAVDDLNTLSGVAKNAEDLGTFTGTTIADNQTVKAALQDLETAHEAHVNDATDAHDASAISYDNATSGLTATQVQAAIDEVEGRLDTAEGSIANKVDKVVSTDNAIARFNGTTGDVQNSTVLVADNGNISQVRSITITGDGAAAPHINGTAGPSLVIAKSGGASIALTTTDVSLVGDATVSQGLNHGLREAISTATNNVATGTNATVTVNSLSVSLVNASLASIANFANTVAPSGSRTARHTIVNNTGNDITLINSASIITGTGKDLVLKNGAALVVHINSSNVAQVIGGTGAGEGGGDFNYIANSGAEDNVNDWVVYANTVASSKPDDFGGTPDAGFTLTQNTTLPLFGEADFLITKPASNVQGHGVYYEFTAENGHLATKQLFKMLANTNDLDDADLSIWLVSSNDDFTVDFNIISANNPDVFAGVPTVFKQFQLDASDTKYRLCLHYASTDTVAKEIFFDDVFLGPKDVALSAVVTDWKPFTPTGSWVTNTTYTGFYRQVGDSAEIHVRVALSGAPTSATLQVNLPSGLSIDTSKISNAKELGTAWISDASVPTNRTKGSVSNAGANNLQIFYIGGSTVTQTTPFTFAASDEVVFMATVPIQGWSSNAVSSEDFGGRDISFVYTGQSQNLANGGPTVIPIQNANISRNTAGMLLNETTDDIEIPETGLYDINATLAFTNSPNVAAAQSVRGVYISIDGANSLRGRAVTSAKQENNTSTVLQANLLGEYLVKGQKISFESRQITGGVLSGTLWASITKRSSPQTILETETVAARYTSNSGQSIATEQTVIFEDLVSDTHNAYNPSTGHYIVPVSGYYNINFKIRTQTLVAAGDRLVTRLYLNASIIEDDVYEAETAAALDIMGRINTTLYLNKGDDFYLTAQASSGDNLIASANSNVFSISKIK